MCATVELHQVSGAFPDAVDGGVTLRNRFSLDDMEATVLLDAQFRRVGVPERQRLADELNSSTPRSRGWNTTCKCRYTAFGRPG